VTTVERQAVVDFFARFSIEEACETLGPLSESDKRAVKRVLGHRHEEIMEEIRRDNLKLEEKEAKIHLRRWYSSHFGSEMLKDLEERSYALCTSAYTDKVIMIEELKKDFRFKLLHRRLWEEKLKSLQSELADLEASRNEDDFIRVCIEVDGLSRFQARGEGILVSHIKAPDDISSARGWVRITH